MTRRILWLTVNGLMVLALLLAACAPAAVQEEEKKITVTEEKETKKEVTAEKEVAQKEAVSTDVPRYGGTLTFVTASEVGTSASIMGGFTYGAEGLWGGDWSKGPAGGYGTRELGWGYSFTDIWELKIGYVAESWRWTIDETKDEGTIVYQIRSGIHYALNPKSPASSLVNGRELTADDVVYAMTTTISDPQTTIYRANPELRVAKISKTGPREVTVKIPISGLANAILRFTAQVSIVPPEVVKTYQNIEVQNRWKYAIASGPFILTDYIPGSVWTWVKNNNYWMKNPIGPGKGNQLPYIDGYRRLIIPDRSTQLAALRTGKADQMTGLNLDEVNELKRTAPALSQANTYTTTPSGVPLTTTFNVTKPPFNDIRVRRAMLMAIDFDAIRQALASGQAEIIHWPFLKVEGYETVYVGINDPDTPATIKELYTYNPEKAKQLLKEAGYPSGFKTSVLTTSGNVDFYSIIKGYLAKIGVELVIDVRESGAKNTLTTDMKYEITSVALPPPTIFYVGNAMSGTSNDNPLRLTPDPLIEETLPKIRRTFILEGRKPAMEMMRELNKYVIDLALAFGGPRAYLSSMWWPWVKNYSGELSGGYGTDDWEKFIWLDQALKKSMGK